MTEPRAPELTGYIRDRGEHSDLMVWCRWCCHWHIHGPEPIGRRAHRGAHCFAPDSPYRETGYWITVSAAAYADAARTVRSATAAQRRAIGLGRISSAVRRLREQPGPTVADRTAQVEAERDGAYRERAQLLAWLATLVPAVIIPATDVDEPGWQLLYLHTAAGQLSWHIAPRDMELFAHVEQVPADDPRAQWDGHSTVEKYERIRRLVTRADAPGERFQRSELARLLAEPEKRA